MRIYTYVEYEWDEKEQIYKEVYAESEEYEGPVSLCSGGGSSSGSTKTTIRYAPYVEEHHNAFLDIVAASRAATIDSSPFSAYTDIDVENAFFGAGYTIASFPTLYDMFGKFMAGLDVEVLRAQLFESIVNSNEVDELVSAESLRIYNDLTVNILPVFKAGMRDSNSVMSSTFIIGESNLMDSKVRDVNKFSAELKYRLIPVAADAWKTHLTWNESVVRNFAEIMKLYYTVRMDVDEANYGMHSKDVLWPFTVLDYEGAAIGRLQGATTTKSGVAGSSTASKAIGGALSGAAAGAMMTPMNPLLGGAIGGVLGLASSLF